jgi:hypothetical protein
VSTARFSFALGLVALIGGCASESGGDGPATFPDKSVETLHLDNGNAIEVRTSPEQPPSRGQSSIELTVLDDEGHAIDGLDVGADPWMPAMGHGAATLPERVVEGGGKYRFDEVELFMPGTWELRVTIADKTKDRATAHFQIP